MLVVISICLIFDLCGSDVCVSVRVYVYMCVCACVCVCV